MTISLTLLYTKISKIAEYETALKGGDYNTTGYAKAARAYRDLIWF